MSVQSAKTNFPLENTCPIVINSTEAIFSYQTASTVAISQNVNGRSPSCFPNDYAYLQVYTAQAAKKCCDNNAVKKNPNSMMMNNY
jgi:hypothetical protein